MLIGPSLTAAARNHNASIEKDVWARYRSRAR
jgi:hypothetical protein